MNEYDTLGTRSAKMITVVSVCQADEEWGYDSYYSSLIELQMLWRYAIRCISYVFSEK